MIMFAFRDSSDTQNNVIMIKLLPRKINNPIVSSPKMVFTSSVAICS